MMPVFCCPLYKKLLLYGLSLADMALITSWAKTPPTTAHTGLSSDTHHLNTHTHTLELNASCTSVTHSM